MMKEKEGVSMFGTELLNARQVAEKLGISYTYFFKIRKGGCPYHQLGNQGRKYYVLKEVQDWLLVSSSQR